MLLRKVKGRSMSFFSVICLISIRHQPSLYLMTISPGFSVCIGTVSALVIISGIFITKYYTEIYGFLSPFPGVRYALGGPLVAPAYDVMGSYSIAWIIAAALSIVMTAFLLYLYRGSRIYTKGQEGAGDTARIQYDNGKIR